MSPAPLLLTVTRPSTRPPRAPCCRRSQALVIRSFVGAPLQRSSPIRAHQATATPPTGWVKSPRRGLMCALPAVTSDIYLPSLPEVAIDLHTTTTAVQLTMSGVLVGGAVGQLVVGPLSDRFGRRRPVLIGVVLHIVISLLCALAPGIGTPVSYTHLTL